MQKWKLISCPIWLKVLYTGFPENRSIQACDLTWYRTVLTPAGTFPNYRLPLHWSTVAIKSLGSKENSILPKPETSKQSCLNCLEPNNGRGRAKEPASQKTWTTRSGISAILRARCNICFMLKHYFSSTLYLLQCFLHLQAIINALKIILKYVLLVGKRDLVVTVSFVKASVSEK